MAELQRSSQSMPYATRRVVFKGGYIIEEKFEPITK